MKFISLGHACQVAHQLKRLGLAKETLFYDWLVTNPKVLIDTLGMGLEERLFQEGYTFPSSSHYLNDVATGLQFYPHDFRGIPERDRDLIDEQVPVVRNRYLRRAKRTREILNSGRKVGVVRHFFDEPLENIADQQSAIVRRMSELYPRTNFEFYWASELDTAAFVSPHGTLHHLPKASVWQGDDQAWENMLPPRTLSRISAYAKRLFRH